LDGELLFYYLKQDVNEKKKLARSIGTSPEQILANLNELYSSTFFF